MGSGRFICVPTDDGVLPAHGLPQSRVSEGRASAVGASLRRSSRASLGSNIKTGRRRIATSWWSLGSSLYKPVGADDADHLRFRRPSRVGGVGDVETVAFAQGLEADPRHAALEGVGRSRFQISYSAS